MQRMIRLVLYGFAPTVLAGVRLEAQQILGAIAGTVLDSSGAVVSDAGVKAHNEATNLEVTVRSSSNGSYSIADLPVGTYTLSFTKEGFGTETHTVVLVRSNRTTTVDANLKVGSVTTVVEVRAVALMNETDATNGYVVDQFTIQDTPLGTGSFTQLAILAPGVHADFWAAPAPTPASAIRPSSPTATAPPATASR